MTTTDQTRPLSVVQQSMWTTYRLAPDSSAYNTVLRLRVRGRVDTEALTRAVRAVQEQHEQVRSLFIEHGGWPCRVPLDEPLDAFVLLDLVGADEAELLNASHSACMTPFRLETEGPLRIVLVRRAPDDGVLVVAAHHIINDFVSRALLVRDLLSAYADAAVGRAPVLKPITASYDEHVGAESRFLASEAGDKAAGRWRQSLAGAEPAELPLDRPRPVVRAYTGDTVERRLPADLVVSLAGAAEAAGVTTFAFLLAAFQTVVHRWTGQDDFLLGVPATARFGLGMREVVGCFTNPLPVRASFRAGDTFHDVASAAGREVLRALSDSRYPSALLGHSTGEQAAPLYHMALFLVDTERMYRSVPRPPEHGRSEGPAVTCAGLRITMIDTPQQEGQLDLLLRMEQGPETISTAYSYDIEVLSRATVERIADGFERVLRSVVAAVGTPVADIPLTVGEDLRELLSLGDMTSGGGTLP
ncbi:condensation domain-containing protein [Streptomyces sp. NPDC050549]|uniref:condensation domain-containing protein n=1 Tax=Streptomyces sp. NPDC050549 TaxID=3155406 RepID=UPI0034279508